MRCIYCNWQDSRVVDSRPTEDNSVIRRRRECEQCGRRFTTYEKAERTPLLVVKKDGRRESFDAEKIRSGIIKSCEKRSVSAYQIDEIVREIESAAYNAMEKEVATETIGEMVMERLRGIDEVAFVRFASVYRHFGDIQAYMDVLNHLLEGRGNGANDVRNLDMRCEN
ncbi:MAG: transcriptional regulator NrdR [Oscillospiraceae bacterium]|jgi:transcriptional repressor NrdR|nr:transcriptional regulator NrdR [Oscillospiraceae bacterium]